MLLTLCQAHPTRTPPRSTAPLFAPAEPRAALGGVATKGLTLFAEIKSFAFKGNIVGLAVGIIIGAAFGTIVDSLVRNVIPPLVSCVTPSTQFFDWKLGKLLVGNLLNDVLLFPITAFAISMFIPPASAIRSPHPGSPC